MTLTSDATNDSPRVTGRWSLAGGPLAFGGDYNPEQWSRDVWREDVALMRECGVNLVTLGVFSWAKVEPRPGEYDFAWFDDVIDLLHENGIAVDLATMSASPPPWLSSAHPESLPVREDGTKLWHGSRRHYCPSSPVYRERVRGLVDTLARRYGRHPALALWHVDNEYTGGVPACHCPASAAHYRRWLRDRYGDVQGLNEAWSTSFWSQAYSSFEEVVPPTPVPSGPNPAAVLDFTRFMSDAYRECYREQVDIIRRHSPDVPITTNLLMMPRAMDLHAWAPDWDVSSIDVYADPLAADAHHQAAFSYDVCRSLRRDRPWLLMEQASGAVNWRSRCGPKPPGVMRSQSLQAVAHGADSVLFFQWRQSRGGAEKFHSAMVPHTGTDSRIHQEVRALGAELASMADVAGSTVVTDVAILMDWENWWAVDLGGHPRDDLDYLGELRRWHGALLDLGLVSDLVHPSADLSLYRYVAVPNLYLLRPEVAQRLEDYVAGGGTLVVGPFSGVVDDCVRLHHGGYNPPLARLLGVRVDEFWPLAPGGSVGILSPSGHGSAREWTEELTTTTATVHASFAGGWLAGRPAVTVNDHGRGRAWYLGGQLDDQTLQRVLEESASRAGVRPALASLPQGVNAVRRRNDSSEFLFLLNHADDPVDVNVDGQVVHLGGRDVALIRTLAPPQTDR